MKTINDFIKNPSEFDSIGREYDCEIPKGHCFKVTVKHIDTMDLYTYYEETPYLSLQDQLENSFGSPDCGWSKNY